MSKKYQESAYVICQEEIGTDIYGMWIKTENIASNAVSGQFVSLYSKDGSRILPRPISICELNNEKTAIRLVYRIAGKGTEEFSHLRSDDEIKITGPLGNGFTLKENRAMLVAGGIGIPPMVELAKELKRKGINDIKAVIGYRNSEMFLKGELEKYCNVYVATEDGSYGVKGNVMDAIKEYNLEADTIYSCGPKPMLKAVAIYAEEKGIEAQVSLEERMACGIGACLGCVCKSKGKDEHSNVNNKRVCADGPVFDSREVEI